MVMDEAELVLNRMNGLLVTSGAIIQAAGASLMTKEGGEHYKSLMNTLAGD